MQESSKIRLCGRHCLARERFPTDVLGLEVGLKLIMKQDDEHVISPSVEDAFLRILEDPTNMPSLELDSRHRFIEMPEGASALSDIEVETSSLSRESRKNLSFNQDF